MDWFEQEISAVSLSDGKLDGILLLHRTKENEIMTVLYTAGGPEYVKNLSYLMGYAAKKTAELYPKDTGIVIHRHNTYVKKLTDKLLSGYQGNMVYSGERSE